MLGLFCWAGGYGEVDLIVSRWEEYDMLAAVEVVMGVKIGYRDYRNEQMSSSDGLAGGVATISYTREEL